MRAVRMLKFLLPATGFLLLHAPESRAYCEASCPTIANCVGVCAIDAGVGSGCGTVCTANCAVAICRLIGGPTCAEVFEQPCERRPAKHRSLDSPWVILEIDEANPLSSAARGVLAASSVEFGKEALASYWDRELQRRDERVTREVLNPQLVRIVFHATPIATDPVDAEFSLLHADAKPPAPPETRYFFRAATNGSGQVTLIESLFTSLPGSEGIFESFVREQYVVESRTTPGVPIHFYGSIRISSSGDTVRGALAATRILPEELTEFSSRIASKS